MEHLHFKIVVSPVPWCRGIEPNKSAAQNGQIFLRASDTLAPRRVGHRAARLRAQSRSQRGGGVGQGRPA
jgi:hypothetical protein